MQNAYFHIQIEKKDNVGESASTAALWITIVIRYISPNKFIESFRLPIIYPNIALKLLM